MTKWISSVELNQRINSAEPTPCEPSCRNTTTRGQSSSIGNTPEQQDTSRDIHMVEFHSIPFQSTTVLRRHYLEGGGMSVDTPFSHHLPLTVLHCHSIRLPVPPSTFRHTDMFFHPPCVLPSLSRPPCLHFQNVMENVMKML